MRAIEILIQPKDHDVGGVTVRRALPVAKRRAVGPFVFFDHIGPARFAPGQGIDVGPHPHIGLATVTYLFDGEMDHADSTGAQRSIRPGAVNWMVAGRGVTHSERTGPQARRDGHVLHGVQTWVALPLAHEQDPPSFHHHPAADLPAFTLNGARMRLILGTAFGRRAPVRSFSPIFYLHAEAPAGAGIPLPGDHAERALYVVSGAVDIDGQAIQQGEMAVLTEGAAPAVTARADAVVMLCGGAPLDGRRTIWWNFVASSRERIEQAKQDWRASARAGFKDSAFALPPGETTHIPLPGDEQPADSPPQPSDDCPTT